jgi:hypothetical protein
MKPGTTYRFPSQRLARVIDITRDELGVIYHCAYVPSPSAPTPPAADLMVTKRFLELRCWKLWERAKEHK